MKPGAMTSQVAHGGDAPALYAHVGAHPGRPTTVDDAPAADDEIEHCPYLRFRVLPVRVQRTTVLPDGARSDAGRRPITADLLLGTWIFEAGAGDGDDDHLVRLDRPLAGELRQRGKRRRRGRLGIDSL
jgi:hypothetical protein